MVPKTFTARRLTEARSQLADLAFTKATETAERVGFGWLASEDAPDSWDKLSTEFTECLASGRRLRVAAVNSEPSIFGNARDNHAMRFWHDVTHIELDADFGFFGEMQVAKSHLTDVIEAGMAEGSLGWHLMRADTVGQNYVFAMSNGGFVSDQLAFAISALTVGLPFAVLLSAVEQIEQRPICARDTDLLLGLLETER